MFLGLSRTHLLYIYIMVVGAESRIHSLWPLWSWWARWLFPEKNWAWEKKANVSTYLTYEREIIRFPPGPKKIAGRPERQNILQRIQHCCWLLFSLCKNTKNISYDISSPIESCGISMEFKPTDRCFSLSVLVRFAAVSLAAGPARRRHATPNRPFRRHSSLPKANRGPWRSQRWGVVFSPWAFWGKNRSVFFGKTVENGGVLFFFHLPIWKICDMSA